MNTVIISLKPALFNIPRLPSLEKGSNIPFKDLDLLAQSLTHKSFNTNRNNEKLEFLGDRVLGLVVAKKLLEIYPK